MPLVAWCSFTLAPGSLTGRLLRTLLSLLSAEKARVLGTGRGLRWGSFRFSHTGSVPGEQLAPPVAPSRLSGTAGPLLFMGTKL